MNDKQTEKDLVWLPKELCEQIKNLNDPFSKECRALINKYIDETRSNYRSELELLDEDVLMYRGLMVKAKKAFEDAKNEHLNASYEMWEKFEKEIPGIDDKIKQITSRLIPLKAELDKINEAFNKIERWNIERLLEMLSKIESCLNNETGTSKILRFLVNEYKRPEEVAHE